MTQQSENTETQRENTETQQHNYVADVYWDNRKRKWAACIREECGSTSVVRHRSLSALRDFLDSLSVGMRTHVPTLRKRREK